MARILEWGLSIGIGLAATALAFFTFAQFVFGENAATRSLPYWMVIFAVAAIALWVVWRPAKPASHLGPETK